MCTSACETYTNFICRYLVWGTPTLAAASAADGHSPADAPSSNGATTPVAGASAPLDEPDGASGLYPKLPKLPPDMSEPGTQHTSSADDPLSSAHTTSAGRPKLSTKRQGGRIQKRAAKHTVPDFGAHIVIEKFDGPGDTKPKGYMGTVAGARIFASTVEDYCACGTGGGHWLICGHEIVSNKGDTACGANCKTGLHAAEPFNCPQCRDTMANIIETKITPAEKASVKFHMSLNISLGISLAVEYVSKHLPTVKGNIAQTLMSIAEPRYGRACQIVPAAVEEPKNFAEIYEEHREDIQQKARARQVEADIGQLTTHDKRKAASTKMVSEPPAVTAVADTANKKQKHKLEIHSEPITDSTRGIKRTATVEDWSDDETLVGEDSPRPVEKNTKRQKKKLETCREPITADTRGQKRGLPQLFTGESNGVKGGLGLLDIYYDFTYNQADKRAVKFRLSKGPRKNQRNYVRQDVSDKDGSAHRNKRVCKWDVLPSEIKESVPLFAIKRVTLEEFAAGYVDGDEL